jgi:hypothetical protein
VAFEDLTEVQVSDVARIGLEVAMWRDLEREGRLRVPWTHLLSYLREHHSLSPLSVRGML